MKRRLFVIAGIVLPLTAWTQAKGVPRVCFLSTSTERAYAPFLEEFRASLNSLGQTEGQTYQLETRWSNERMENFPALIAECLALNPALVVTHGSPAVAQLQKATGSVPIVFASA